APFPARSPAAAGGAPSRPAWALAAALALVSLGLGAWSLVLQRRAARLSQPALTSSLEIALEQPRAADEVEVTAGGGPLLLYLVLVEPYPCRSFDLELGDAAGGLLWRREVDLPPPPGELELILPRPFLDRRPATLRLFGDCDGGRRLLVERRLRIRRPQEGAP
ncbi:MAG: hypothetical protein D6696_13545, partial [Acidobacteria bacterium]